MGFSVLLDVINFTYCHTLQSQQSRLRFRELRHVTSCEIFHHASHDEIFHHHMKYFIIHGIAYKADAGRPTVLTRGRKSFVAFRSHRTLRSQINVIN